MDIHEACFHTQHETRLPLKALLSDSMFSKFLWTTLTVLGIGKESVGGLE